MRKRWEFSPGPFIALWAIGGFIALMVIVQLTDGCYANGGGCGLDGPVSKTVAIAAAVWAAPFVIALVGYILIAGIPAMLEVLWEARPKRVAEPVTEDLREVED